jgi:hypothetical protein
MSTTICVGYSLCGKADIFEDVRVLADRFGYGILHGIHFAEGDVREGIEAAMRHQGWENVLFLQSPIDGNIALAFGIEQEMTNKLIGNIERPPFFDFVIDLASLSVDKCKKIGILFASECFEDDPIRFMSGAADDLVRHLAVSGSWEITFLGKKPNEYQGNDEFPLLFNFELEASFSKSPKFAIS